MSRDVEFERVLVALMVELKRTGMECHTKIKGGSFIIVKRRPRKSRLTNDNR